MSKPKDLKDLYTHELQDLWSANDQMKRVVEQLADMPCSQRLKDLLNKSIPHIDAHTQVVKQLLEANGAEVKKEHCKGMQGLVEEARKHAIEEAPDQGPVLDAVIIAQYQRMTHYGIAGFGTAAAFAEALGNTDDAAKLNKATKHIYHGDEYATVLAETSINARADRQ